MISAKRQAFNSQIRSKQKNKIITKIRCRVTKQTRLDVLQTIINKTTQQSHITRQQLIILIKWGLYGQQNAIIHLGNLIIDQILDIQAIRRIQDQSSQFINGIYGDNEYYMWLLDVLYERNYFKQKQLSRLVLCVIRKVKEIRDINGFGLLESGSLFHEHGLELLRKIVRKHTSAAQLILFQNNHTNNHANTNNTIQHRQLVQSLLHICISQTINPKILQTCLSILTILSSTSNSTTNILNLCPQELYIQAAKLCMYKLSSKIRCMNYQILTNLVVQCSEDSKVQNVVVSLLGGVLLGWEKQKQCVQLEILYLIVACVDKFVKEIVKYLILEFGLLGYVKNILNKCLYKYEHRQNSETSHQQFTPITKQILQNCIQTLSNLIQNRHMFNFSQIQQIGMTFYLFDKQTQSKINNISHMLTNDMM